MLSKKCGILICSTRKFCRKIKKVLFLGMPIRQLRSVSGRTECSNIGLKREAVRNDPVQPQIVKGLIDMTNWELVYCLTRFIIEVRKKNVGISC